MTRGLWFILKLSLGIALAIWLVRQEGSVTMIWSGYRIDSSIGFFLLVVILLMALAAVLDNIWERLRGVTHNVLEWRRMGRRKKAMAALTKAFVALSSGDGKTAQAQVPAIRKGYEDDALAEMIAAQAAGMLGDAATERAAWLALAKDERTMVLGWRGLIEQALRQGDLIEARKLAVRARDLAPRDHWLLQTLADLQLRTGRWEAAVETLADAEKRGAIDADEARRKRLAALLEHGASLAMQGDFAAAAEQTQKALDIDGGSTAAAVATAGHLHRAGQASAAKAALERAWSHGASAELASAWLAIEAPDGDAAQRLAALRALTGSQPKDNLGRLLLAEAAIAAGAWDQAEAALGDAVNGSPDPRVLRLAALIAEQDQTEPGKALRLWRRAAELAIKTLLPPQPGPAKAALAANTEPAK